MTMDLNRRLAEELRLRFENSPLRADIEVGGGADWVVNLTPTRVPMPGRVKKLIGVKKQTNRTLISLPVSVFPDLGIATDEEFFGVTFTKTGSYMMLSASPDLTADDLYPVLSRWILTFLQSKQHTAQSGS